MPRLPYATRPQHQIVKVGNPLIGEIYLLKEAGALTCEMPPSMQKRVDRSDASKLVLQDLALVLKEQSGQSFYHCLRKLYLAPVLDLRTVSTIGLVKKYHAGDTKVSLKPDHGVEGTEWLRDGEKILMLDGPDSADDSGNTFHVIPAEFDISAKAQLVSDTINIAQLATDEQMAIIRESNKEIPELKFEAATTMVQNRLLHAVTVLERAPLGSTILTIKPIDEPLSVGDRVKFGPVKVTVAAALSIGEVNEVSQRLEVEKTSDVIEPNSVGFVLEGSTYRTGIEWSEADTNQEINEPLQEELLKFFNEVRTGQIGESSSSSSAKNEPVGKQQSLPEKSGTDPQLTGANTFGESNPTGQEMNGSTPKTLVVSQSG
ncbi:MAG: hypothetical protein AAGD25_06865 [Cyanobacteria bacterium P01_F01_bin.150]